jgi:hypothetical protein
MTQIAGNATRVACKTIQKMVASNAPQFHRLGMTIRLFYLFGSNEANMSTKHQSLNDTPSAAQQDVYIDRRSGIHKRNSPGLERRQFTDGHANLTPEAAELGHAIDRYKLENRRRYISYEEMLAVIKSIGYRKS